MTTVPTKTAAPAPKQDAELDKAAADLAVANKEAAILADEAEEEAAEEIAKNGDPIECVCIKKFFDDRGATVVPGETYFYIPKPKTPFPAELLEPKNRVLAKAAAADYASFQEHKREIQRRKAVARDQVLRALGGE